MLGRKILLKIKPYKPGKPIEEVQRELNLKNVIKLASNENSLGPSRLAVEAIRKSLDSINRYPESSSFYLRKVLASRLNLSGENLIFGNGSDEIITLALRAFVNKGDEVVIAEPTFLIYQIAAAICEAKVKPIEVKNGFRYDLDGMKKAVTRRTKLVFIGNPDNPLGTYVTSEEVEKFLSGLPKDVIVFFDEAYYEFAKDLKDYPDTLRLINRKNIIIARTFSKLYGLAGLRIGYGIADRRLIGCMEKVREPFNVNSLAQAAALAALKDKRHIERTLKLVREGKRYVYSELARMELDFIESATNFILVDTGTSAKFIFDRLLRRGVIVRDMGQWGLPSFIRVTVGTMDENERFIRELRSIL